MPKDPVSAGLAKAGIAAAGRHVFVCLGPDCCDPAEGEALWEHVKSAVKASGLPVMRTKAQCFRICAGGPWLAVYPEGVWYGGVTPGRFDRILREHLGENRPVAEWISARNGCPARGEISGAS
jgi:(2Fe-2S) ferredoxin